MAVEFRKKGDKHETKNAKIRVAPTLKPGKYRFRLVVVDDQGIRSPPDTVVVTVVRKPDPSKKVPIAKIHATNPRPTVGTKFNLIGAGSFDPDGGTIRKYKWTLVRTPESDEK